MSFRYGNGECKDVYKLAAHPDKLLKISSNLAKYSAIINSLEM